MNYNNLIQNIETTHNVLQSSVAKIINRGLTIRNWLIGYYIVEFEQNGQDRATYGDNLLKKISASTNIKGLSVTNLKTFRQFYKIYPSISKILSDFFNDNAISQSLTDQFKLPIRQSVTDQFKTIDKIGIAPSKIISKLSFTHLVELLKIEDDLKRAFYELVNYLNNID